MNNHRTISMIVWILFLLLLSQRDKVEAISDEYKVFFPLSARMNAWQEVGIGSASGGGISNTQQPSGSPDIDVAQDDTPYVVWDESTEEITDIYVRRWNGSEWEEVGIASASGGGISKTGNAANPVISIAQDGTPYAAWDAFVGQSLGFYEIHVRRWNGNDWVEVGSGSASNGGISGNPGVSRWPSMAASPDGFIYVAWQDNSSPPRQIYVKRWNGTTWEEVGPGSASGGGVSNTSTHSEMPSITISSDGIPYIAWVEYVDGESEIYIRYWNGTTWEEVGIGSASGGGISNTGMYSKAPSVAVAPDGTLYVTWMDYDGSISNRVYIRRWNGLNWVQVGPGSATGGGIGQGIGSAENPAVTIAPDGMPYVTWRQWDEASETGEIYVRRWNGNQWVEAGMGSATGGGISNTGTGCCGTIAIGPSGTIFVAWHEYGFDGYSEIYVRQYSE